MPVYLLVKSQDSHVEVAEEKQKQKQTETKEKHSAVIFKWILSENEDALSQISAYAVAINICSPSEFI